MENLKIDCCGFNDKQKQEVVYELNRLGFITGHKSIDFYTFVYGCTGNTAYNNTIQFGNTAKTFAKNKGREVTLDELKQIPSEGSQTEQGLISGADALRALADGETVEVKRIHDSEWQPAQIFGVSVFTDSETTSFRLKPRTIKLEIEIPAPFEPKDGDNIWHLNTHTKCGYSLNSWSDDGHDAFMLWRTEEEIKQVVAALRGALKND